ncbi:MAG: N,N'-diacetylbacillosaminyl-diphospho-undecaprenol alpha-1,3-N-acetylgalactosaminyltransferase [Dehalococcoidia bacterium]|nr:glycosyltransferase family 4 protein [Serpentinimonas barnesii]MBT9159435.1 N,N'-diacetylbacillosaminyl-diphospho-undecaprenol alpha-1,3-N-acetylgalactosaminyltransferase [Chloroflexota bacterium]
MPYHLTIVSQCTTSVLNFRSPLIEALCAVGVHVQVLAPNWQPQTEQAAQALGAQTGAYTLSRAGLNPLGDLRTAVQLWRSFKAHKPDVVFTHAAKTNVWGMLAAALAGVPHRVAMVEGMGYAFTEGANGRSAMQRLLGVLLASLYRLAFKLAHRVVVLNPDDAADLQRLCGLPPHKTVLLGGIGVPLQDWPLHPPHTEPISFTLIARLLREKGILEYLQAARLVKAQHPQLRFYLLGALDENPGALSQADIQPWLDDGTVEWPGQVNVKPWLAKTSVYVLPSYYREGVPRSTQEAMAMGRPVITTDAPGCRETVVEGVNGFLVPPRDVPALASALLRFVHNPGLVATMGAQSRRLAEERFDVNRINQKLMEVLGVGAKRHSEG